MNTPVKCCSSVWHEWYGKYCRGKLLPLICFLVFLLFLGWLHPPALSFTPGRWDFAKKYNNSWLLVAMREDLIVQLKNSRMTKQEVVDLLGSSDQHIQNSTTRSVSAYKLGTATYSYGNLSPVFWTLYITYFDGVLDEAGVSGD